MNAGRLFPVLNFGLLVEYLGNQDLSPVSEQAKLLSEYLGLDTSRAEEVIANKYGSDLPVGMKGFLLMPKHEAVVSRSPRRKKVGWTYTNALREAMGMLQKVRGNLFPCHDEDMDLDQIVLKKRTEEAYRRLSQGVSGDVFPVAVQLGELHREEPPIATEEGLLTGEFQLCPLAGTIALLTSKYLMTHLMHPRILCGGAKYQRLGNPVWQFRAGETRLTHHGLSGLAEWNIGAATGRLPTPSAR